MNLENNMNLENIMKFGNYRKPSWNLKILNLENIHKFEEYHGICKYHWYFENIIEIWKISWNWKISQIWKILLKFGKSLLNLENIMKLAKKMMKIPGFSLMILKKRYEYWRKKWVKNELKIPHFSKKIYILANICKNLRFFFIKSWQIFAEICKKKKLIN